MSAAAVDLPPEVECGRGGGEHDQVLLHQTQPTHVRSCVEGGGPGQDLPGDVVGRIAVLQLPDMT